MSNSLFLCHNKKPTIELIMVGFLLWHAISTSILNRKSFHKTGAMQMRNNLFIFFVAVLILTGCSQAIRLESESIKKQLVIGESTKEDVCRLCGEPQYKRMTADNTQEIWHYAYIDKNVTPLGVLGHVAGLGVETKSHSVVFEPKFSGETLIDFSLNEGNTQHFSLQ